MKKKLASIVTCTLLTPMFLNGTTNAVYADSKTNQISTTQENQQKEMDRRGLLGYYFKGKDFNNLTMFAPTRDNTLIYDQQTVNVLLDKKQQEYQSIRWIGLIQSKETGDFTFNLSEDEQAIIEIDGKIISNKGKEKQVVHLEKGILVPIKIEYQSDTKFNIDSKTFKELKLFKIDSQNQSQQVQRDELRQPEFNKKESQEFLAKASKTNFFMQKMKRDIDEDTDTDGDSIPDLWEENGYTIQKKVAVKWDDKFAQQGYVKYLSSPYQAHTAGDPYTDWEKAAGDIPKSNAAATRNPLVAAFPSINVDMRKMILSKDSNFSNSAETHSNNSYTYANSEGASINAGFSFKEGLSFGTSANYQHTETVGADWGSSQSNTEQFNSASAGYLNANVHYNNVGTGGIYDAQPTTSFILQDSTIATITAKSNATALSIPSGDRYPASKEGISLKTMDDFNSHPITLNKPQLDAVLNNEVIKINTDQTDGRYGIIGVDGKAEIGDRWSPIMDEIKGSTASIIIDPDDGKALETRIAAKDYKNPEDKTPSLTIKEGLKIAYPESISEDKDGILFYEYKSDEGKLTTKQLSEENVMTYIDEATSKEFERQLSDGSAKGLYDIKLTPKMNITIRLATVTLGFDDQFSAHPWENATWNENIGNLRPGSLFVKNAQSEYIIPEDIVKPNYNYLITGYIKHLTSDPDAPVTISVFTKNNEGRAYNTSERLIFQNQFEGFGKFTIKTENISGDHILDSILLIPGIYLGPNPNDHRYSMSYLDDIAIIPIGPNKSR